MDYVSSIMSDPPVESLADTLFVKAEQVQTAYLTRGFNLVLEHYLEGAPMIHNCMNPTS